MTVASREAEVAQLSLVYGQPLRQRHVLQVSPTTFDWWTVTKPRRTDGEVALLIRRCNGSILLHGKQFYPRGAMRLPTGGILAQESLVDAALREALEETGLLVEVERFLAVVEFEFCCGGLSVPFPSYLFLLRDIGGELRPCDPEEQIAAYAEVPCIELTYIAASLENLPSEWSDWGAFRALPHRLAATLLATELTSPTYPDTARTTRTVSRVGVLERSRRTGR